MAVTDDRIYHPTDALILRKSKRHYRVGLRVEHWQLRSQIGLSSPRHIYYPGGNDNNQIHKLDTASHESETIKILTFAPRCLVAKNGWICAGGESGEFVAIPVDDGSQGGDSGRSHAERDLFSRYRRSPANDGPNNSDQDHWLDAFHEYVRSGTPNNERLQQLGIEADSNHDSDDSIPPLIQPSRMPQPNSDKSLHARSKTFGKDRVNCITLWVPQDHKAGRFDGAYSTPVAVLANNDKHVTVVGLQEQEAVDELVYPDCVNRALISPDGRLLAAVCDDPYLYVHERVTRHNPCPGLFTRKEDFEWRLCAKIPLKGQRKEDRSDQRGSFAACFSNTGRFLAVGTQYGMISIFDTASFVEPGIDPLITTFTSSRSKEDVGAVRDMAFCPGPFDLLAWTEHRGRVGVADIRSNYVSRQMLNLNGHDDFEQIMVTERGSIDPRLLERNDNGELSYSSISTAENRRAARRQATDYHSPLTPEETMVIEALQEHRRRREQAAARNNPTSSSNMSRLMERLHNNRQQRENATALALNDSSSRLRSETTSNSRRVGDILSDIQSQRDRLRDQSDRLREQSERVRARRLAVDEAERHRLSGGSIRALRAPLVLPQSGESPRQVYINNSYTDLEALYQSAFDGGAPAASGDGPYEPGQGESTGNRTRDYLSVWSNMLRDRDMEGEPTSRLGRTRLDRLANMPVGRIDREDDDTAGLAWSEDGRILIIGAVDGIYEFHVNLFSRRVFPSMEMR
ncbi:hypothetical protein Daus18300_000428 [Diaporthe australafricana]|uniref:DUF2415 domain-containing protein n=1 Tax=Diaporthe australafricana TaxID=127596 RepID=A0ABR3Y3B1_9PEZI